MRAILAIVAILATLAILAAQAIFLAKILCKFCRDMNKIL